MKNIIVTLLLMISSSSSFAQDTLYFDYNWHEVKSAQKFEYYRILNRDVLDTNKVCTKTYYKSGQIQEELNYSKYSNRIKNGTQMMWYHDGQLKSEGNYVGNLLDGQLHTFWPDGKLKRNDKYDMATLIEGHTYSASGRDVKHYEYEILPEFVGGYADYLASNIIYPTFEAQSGIQGKVYVQFLINTRGVVKDVRVVNGVSKGIDKEALRVVQEMPRWKPAMADGIPINFYIKLPINFKLN